MKIDNMMTRVKMNNEIDLCEIIAGKGKRANDVRNKLEAALQYARISYFLHWEEPGFFRKVFLHEKPTLVFCVNAAQREDALEVLDDLGFTDQEVHLLDTERVQGRYSI